jgi:hypothetical protein
LILSLDLLAGFARYSRWICSLLSLDLLATHAGPDQRVLAGFPRYTPRILLLIHSLDSFTGFARYPHWTLPMRSQWILALLSYDSLADSLVGFVCCIYSQDSRIICSQDSRTEFARSSPWIHLLTNR